MNRSACSSEMDFCAARYSRGQRCTAQHGIIANVAEDIGGAPVSVLLAIRRDTFELIKGEIARFNLSPGRWRGFCADAVQFDMGK